MRSHRRLLGEIRQVPELAKTLAMELNGIHHRGRTSTAFRGLILKSGGSIIPIAGPGDAAPGGGFFFSFTQPSLGPQGQVAFIGNASFPGTGGVYLFANGATTQLIPSGTPANTGEPVIDDRGDVAFTAFLTGTTGGFFGSGGIFLNKNGVVSRIVGPNDPSPDGGVFLFADSPSINSSGDVAFFGETSAFGSGAFVYSGGKITQVVVAGDFVNDIGLGLVDLPVINSNGHVAFTATLFNGQNAVFAAAPQGDPNPTLSDRVLPVHGTAPAPQFMKESRAKNDQLQKRGRPHSGANVKVINPQHAPNNGGSLL